MGDIQDDVRAANESFYAALSGLDIERMSALWLHDERVCCVHPGGDRIEGWIAIEASWAQLFGDRSWLRVVATGVEVDVVGDLAVVVCHESITVGEGTDVRLEVAVSTNLYLRTPKGWRMIHHHASSAPVTVTQAFTGTVQ